MAAPVDPTIIAQDLAVWRAAHPRATLAEIEAQVDAGYSAYRSQTIVDLASAIPETGPPRCAACDLPMQRHGVRTRRLLTRDEGQLDLSLPRYRCSACGAELSPPE